MPKHSRVNYYCINLTSEFIFDWTWLLKNLTKGNRKLILWSMDSLHPFPTFLLFTFKNSLVWLYVTLISIHSLILPVTVTLISSPYQSCQTLPLRDYRLALKVKDSFTAIIFRIIMSGQYVDGNTMCTGVWKRYFVTVDTIQIFDNLTSTALTLEFRHWKNRNKEQHAVNKKGF